MAVQRRTAWEPGSRRFGSIEAPCAVASSASIQRQSLLHDGHTILIRHRMCTEAYQQNLLRHTILPGDTPCVSISGTSRQPSERRRPCLALVRTGHTLEDSVHVASLLSSVPRIALAIAVSPVTFRNEVLPVSVDRCGISGVQWTDPPSRGGPPGSRFLEDDLNEYSLVQSAARPSW